MLTHRETTRTFSKYCNLVRITSKGLNIFLGPFHCKALILKSVVSERSGGRFVLQLLECEPSQRIQTIVSRHNNNIIVLNKSRCIVFTKLPIRTQNPSSAVDPLKNRTRRLFRTRLGYVHAKIETILSSDTHTFDQIKLRAESSASSLSNLLETSLCYP